MEKAEMENAEINSAGSADYSNSESESVSESSSVDVGVGLDLPNRVSRGKKYGRLIGEALEEDEAFWTHETWKDEEQDKDYICSEGEDQYKDHIDTDFDTSESEIEEKKESDYHEKRKKKTKKHTYSTSKNYLIPKTDRVWEPMDKNWFIAEAEKTERENTESLKLLLKTERDKNTIVEEKRTIDYKGDWDIYISWPSDKGLTENAQLAEGKDLHAKELLIFTNCKIPMIYQNAEPAKAKSNKLNAIMSGNHSDKYLDNRLMITYNSVSEFKQIRRMYKDYYIHYVQEGMNEIHEIITRMREFLSQREYSEEHKQIPSSGN